MTWRIVRWWSSRRVSPVLESLVEAGFVALDLETTGLDPRTDAVVSAAAIPFVGGGRLPGLVTLVNPGRPISPSSTAIHGITDEMVVDAPGVAGVIVRIDAVLDGRVIVGHGVAFDLAVLARDRRRLGLPSPVSPALCTMRLAGALWPDSVDLSLEAVAARLGLRVVGRHTAEGDAIAAGQIFLALLPALRGRGCHTVADLVWFQGRTPIRR